MAEQHVLGLQVIFCSASYGDFVVPVEPLLQAAAFPRLDILINNAAQTVRRPAAHYSQLVQGEKDILPESLATQT